MLDILSRQPLLLRPSNRIGLVIMQTRYNTYVVKNFIVVFLSVTALLVGSMAGGGQTSPAAAPLNDPVAQLDRRLQSGETKLEYSADGWGYLRSLLMHLDINVDSQVLVFSKTSFQLNQISPKTPRAIHFNDSVAIGSVQDGKVFELTSLDPAQGIIYYTLDTRQTDQPRFERRFSECLNCHGPSQGLVVSSVFPTADGMPFVTGTFFEGIDHRTPLDKRWGGWYVSGTHGSLHHMGNAVAPDSHRPFDLETIGTQNLTVLNSKFDTAKYLAPDSDIVALMTLEHQTRMTNLIVNSSRQFRRATFEVSRGVSSGRLDDAVDQIVAYMLFADEAPIPDPIAGVSTFAKTFPERGPKDKHGRSLRDFDLQKRLFRYPLSYMIYSDIFDAMPVRLQERVYRGLYDVLIGKDRSEKFARLSEDDRRAILEILRDTKSGLPDYYFAVLIAPEKRN